MEDSLIIKKLERIENFLLSQKIVFNLDEVAEFTGLSKSHLYKLTSTAEIPHYKPKGKFIYFNRVEIEKWLLKNRVSTKNEIDQMATSYVTLNKRGGTK